MQRETITPTDEAHWLAMRRQDLTSTDIAALFGMSPYKTAFEVWHAKKSGEEQQIQVNDRMRWGNRLESAIARGIAEDQGWTVAPFKTYGRLPNWRLGSSFDFRILTAKDGVHQTTNDDGVLEIKTVDSLAFKQGWLVEEDSIEAPAHIEIQLQHQMLVSGLRWGVIGALVGGNDVRLIRRDADSAVQRAILAKADAFWKSIDANQPPPPVYPDDARAVIALNQSVAPEKIISLDGNADALALMEEYRAASDAEKAAQDRKDTAKARLLELIGDAEKARAGRYTITAGYHGEVEIPAYTRKGFRAFRLTTKKETAK